jgi:hypothetical protein
MAALLGVAMASGCTSATAGTPHAASSETSSTSDQPPGSGDDLPSNGAPKVDNPLDVSRFEEHPCEALTPADAETLNVPPTGEQSGDEAGETCYWRNSQTRGSLSLTFFSEDGHGLSSVYEDADSGEYQYFEPIEDIEGFPAVAFNPSANKPAVDCGVVVGVSDKLAFMARVALSEANVGKKEPCAAAAQAAGMLLTVMKEGS